MDPFISYVVNGNEQHLDRHFIYDKSPEFFLGDLSFYDFCFSPTSSTLDSEIAAWLEAVRHKHGYVRLWFSGGKDSRLILDCAMRNKIHIDEVVVMMPLPCGEFVIVGSASEIISQAYPILEKVPYKISVVKLYDEHLTAVFSDPTWIQRTQHYYFYASMYQSLFFRDINPRFNLLSSTGADVVGFIEPHLWVNRDTEQWQFCFLDKQINAVYPSVQVPSFSPKVLNAFLHPLIANLKKAGVKPVKFDPVYRQRKIKSFSPDYQQTSLPKFAFDYPKWRDTPPTDYHGRFMGSAKDQFLLSYLSGVAIKPASFVHWRDTTPWNIVDNEPYRRGISTREFTIIT